MADREIEDYRNEKRKEGEREKGRAKRLHDDGDRRKPRSATAGADKGGVPPDARGQARRGRIDQIVTSKGYTETQ